MKWNESGFRPPLCTYRLNWARRTSWGWWDDWDDTVLQTQESKFEPWRSEAEHATSRSRRPPTILTFTRGWGRNIFVSFKPPRPGTEPRTLAWKAAVLTTTLGPPPCRFIVWYQVSDRSSDNFFYNLPHGHWTCSFKCHFNSTADFLALKLSYTLLSLSYTRYSFTPEWSEACEGEVHCRRTQTLKQCPNVQRGEKWYVSESLHQAGF